MKQQADHVRAAVEQLLDRVGEVEAQALLSVTGHSAARQELARLTVTRLAMRLLEERAPRWQVRDRLVARGLSRRTAYRLIDAALTEPVTSRATDGVDLARDLRSIDCTQPMECDLTTTINDMAAKLKALQDERATIDIVSLRRKGADAEAAREANARAMRDALSRREAFNPNEAQRRHAELATEARDCAFRLREGMARAQSLDREIERLSSMLNATERIALAVEASQASQKVIACAQGNVEKAEEALRRIDELINIEQRAFVQAQNDAAAQLLTAVKTGSDPSEVHAATRDKISTLEIARVSAQQELHAAQAAKSAAVEQHRKSLANVDEARADEAALEHEIAFHQYVTVLSKHIVANGRARRRFIGLEDPRIKAGEIAQKQLGA